MNRRKFCAASSGLEAYLGASNTAVEFGVSRKIRVYCSSEIEEFFDKSCPAAAAGYEESTSIQFDCSRRDEFLTECRHLAGGYYG